MKSIIVFGDSITFGRGDNEYKEGWVGRLRKFVKSKDGYWCLFNLGIPSGETVSDVIKRIKTESLSRFKAKYDDDELFIILNIGLNDSKLNGNKPITPIPKFQKEVQDLITISKKLTDKIIWIGPMPVNEKSVFKTFETYLFKNSSIKKYNELLKIVCNKNNISYLDLSSFLGNSDMVKLMSSDGVHPNAKGYDKIAERISSFIKDVKLFQD